MLEIAAYNNACKKDPSLAKIGLGFLYIQEIYKNFPIVIEFYANKMLDELFYPQKSSFEEKLHTIIKSKEDINKVGINNFIINYVNIYDNYLSGYIATKVSEDSCLIDKLKKDITKAIDRWYLYEKYNYERKIDIIWKEGSAEYEKYKTNYTFSQFLDTVIIKLGLKKLYEKYSDGDFCGEPIVEEITELGDISFINYLEGLVYKEFTTKTIDKTPNDYDRKTTEVFGFPKGKKKIRV